MSNSPCNSDQYLLFESLEGIGGGQNLDGQLNFYGFFLSLGLTCADIRPDFDANTGPGGWEAGNYLKNGDSVSNPQGGLDITWPPNELTWNLFEFSANKGFSIEVTEFKYAGAGNAPTPVSLGILNVGWILDSVSCSETGFPTLQFKHVMENGIGGMPLVIGSGDTVGFSIAFGPYSGPAPFTGTLECGAQTTNFLDNVSGNQTWGPNYDNQYPVLFTTPGTFHKFVGVSDLEALWCCVTAGYDCCSGPSSNPYAPHFLIPPPTTPAPGEENVTQPPLKSLLLLSNHTFQFPANYGVQKK